MESKVGTEPEQSITSLCGVCPAGCAVEVHLTNGRIRRISPLKNHPHGIVCPRGRHAAEIVYSPDRILYPQKRNESGELTRVNWDEAYEGIVGRLKEVAARFGPESICVYTGRGNFEYALNEAFSPSGTVESSANTVLFPFGSPNTAGVGSLCYVSYGMLASRSLFGEYMRNVKEDIEASDLILVWGENPSTDSAPDNLSRLIRAKRRGARIIVIDHRHTESAKATRAEWVGIRPGTDGALALGMIHVLIAENLIDFEFVANWTHGFDDLSVYVEQFTPERVEAITWVPAATIRDIARAIAAARGCSILTYTGLEYSNSGVQAIRAVWALQALGGHFDRPGGKVVKMPNRLRLNRIMTEPPAGKPPIGAAEYPLYHAVRNEAHAALLPKAILEGEPYPIRAMIISGSSLLTAWPDPPLWRRALASLDLLVVINRFPTADAAYAQYVLPATTMFEIESYIQHDEWVQWRQRVIEPVGEARNDYLIFAELARRLGYGERWPQTEEDMINAALEGSGITLDQLKAHPQGIHISDPTMVYRKYETGELRADGRPGFETPTGKFELASEWFRNHNHEPLPVYTDPVEGPLSNPQLAAHYPLVFNSGARTQTAFRSQHHNIPSLSKRQPVPQVWLHPKDARTRQISDGDEVWVATPRGQGRYQAYITEDIVPGVVEVNMGGGGPLGPLAWQSSNVNDLTDMENRDPISGFPVYKALLCEVRRD
jgi:anaerobic selenocysteine-containing dehydrogenase